ncbi:hypothetical protein GCM10008959_25810 [Deinococcus seoulensis]|uniref:Uncharacterized protein n=1 Tax=Deinococcus seoulensis TaxID=1837379 RepID=A0ABQ2RTA9_9DEIO|nr:hypothetical protein [Deinococcus seoulensis]GGR62616.1 hypothetical protein GCM10008959_25810 [Deinococcus seoulensis]
MTHATPTVKTAPRFNLALIVNEARLHGAAFNILNPTCVITVDGAEYSLEWFHTEFSNMGRTLIYTVTVTHRDTGRRVEYRVIEAVRRNRKGEGKVHYNCRYAGMNVHGFEEASEHLAQTAAAFLARRAAQVAA